MEIEEHLSVEVRFQTTSWTTSGACPNRTCGPSAQVYGERRRERREEEVQ